MPTPFPSNSPGPVPVHILHSHTLVIRRGFYYSFELNVVAQPGRPKPTFRSFLPQSPVDSTPTAANQSRTSTSTDAPRAALGELGARENGRRKNASSKHRSREVQRLDDKNTPTDPSKKIAPTGSKSVPARRVAGRSPSKRSKILEMIKRSGGATLAEIRAFSGWQAHSVRAFVSTVAKKDRIRIRSMKNKAGERVYLIRG